MLELKKLLDDKKKLKELIEEVQESLNSLKVKDKDLNNQISEYMENNFLQKIIEEGIVVKRYKKTIDKETLLNYCQEQLIEPVKKTTTTIDLPATRKLLDQDEINQLSEKGVRYEFTD